MRRGEVSQRTRVLSGCSSRLGGGRILHSGATRDRSDVACRDLRLPTTRGQFSDLYDAAARDQMTRRGFLAEPLPGGCGEPSRRRSGRCTEAVGEKLPTKTVAPHRRES